MSKQQEINLVLLLQARVAETSPENNKDLPHLTQHIASGLHTAYTDALAEVNSAVSI
jgi:hypothetical protein